MMLVAGGQLDPNIGRLLRRLLTRRMEFRDVLVGPELHPRVILDVRTAHLYLNGELIEPSAGFVRHDVFLQQTQGSPYVAAASLNWFHAVRGWLSSRPNIRCLNRRSELIESNKLRNLQLARDAGLPIPETVITNDFSSAQELFHTAQLIQKPVAGGEFTTDLGTLCEKSRTQPPIAKYPRFIQERLGRPELRVYRIGDTVFAFFLSSEDLDYREQNRVTIQLGQVPREIADRFLSLCEKLGLDFAAGDFMKRPHDGEYCFLEVNSQPMFAAFDIATDGRLCDAIIDYLCL